jgi:hypothetical protein
MTHEARAVIGLARAGFPTRERSGRVGLQVVAHTGARAAGGVKVRLGFQGGRFRLPAGAGAESGPGAGAGGGSPPRRATNCSAVRRWVTRASTRRWPPRGQRQTSSSKVRGGGMRATSRVTSSPPVWTPSRPRSGSRTCRGSPSQRLILLGSHAGEGVHPGAALALTRQLRRVVVLPEQRPVLARDSGGPTWPRPRQRERPAPAPRWGARRRCMSIPWFEIFARPQKLTPSVDGWGTSSDSRWSSFFP